MKAKITTETVAISEQSLNLYPSLAGVNGVVVGPWAQNRKIKSSSIAGALLIPHTC